MHVKMQDIQSLVGRMRVKMQGILSKGGGRMPIKMQGILSLGGMMHVKV